MTEKTTTYVRELETQIRFLRKQIGFWAKTLTEILEGHFEIASANNLQTVRLIREMEAVAGKEESAK